MDANGTGNAGVGFVGVDKVNRSNYRPGFL